MLRLKIYTRDLHEDYRPTRKDYHICVMKHKHKYKYIREINRLQRARKANSKRKVKIDGWIKINPGYSPRKQYDPRHKVISSKATKRRPPLKPKNLDIRKLTFAE